MNNNSNIKAKFINSTVESQNKNDFNPYRSNTTTSPFQKRKPQIKVSSKKPKTKKHLNYENVNNSTDFDSMIWEQWNFGRKLDQSPPIDANPVLNNYPKKEEDWNHWHKKRALKDIMNLVSSIKNKIIFASMQQEHNLDDIWTKKNFLNAHNFGEAGVAQCFTKDENYYQHFDQDYHQKKNRMNCFEKTSNYPQMQRNQSNFTNQKNLSNQNFTMNQNMDNGLMNHNNNYGQSGFTGFQNSQQSYGNNNNFNQNGQQQWWQSNNSDNMGGMNVQGGNYWGQNFGGMSAPNFGNQNVENFNNFGMNHNPDAPVFINSPNFGAQSAPNFGYQNQGINNGNQGFNGYYGNNAYN